MALSFAHGAIQWLAADAATTVYTVSGLSFRPAALRFYWQGLGSATDTTSSTVHARRGVGLAIATSNRRCVATQDQDAALAMTCTTSAWNDCVVATVTSTPARDGALDLNSITSDGFTLVVDVQGPVNLTVFWEAWAGSDINDLFVGNFAEPAAGGNVSYLSGGGTFKTSVVMLAGVQATSMNAAARNDSGLFIGYTTGIGQDVVVCGNNDDGSANADTDGLGQSGLCLAMIPVAGGASPTARASLNAFVTDGFELNWLERGVTGRITIFLAIEGGAWRAGAFTINTATLNSTATVSGLPFTPVGLCTIGRRGNEAETAADTAAVQDQFYLGTASSTSSRRCMSQDSTDAGGSASIHSVIEYDQLHVSHDGPASGTMDLDAILPNGFRVIVDTAYTANNAAHWEGYLAFGDMQKPLPRRPYLVPIGA